MNQPFEFSQELRKLAEANVEQARAMYGHFIDTMMLVNGHTFPTRRSARQPSS